MVNATSPDAIDRVLLELNGQNVTMTKQPSGLYSYNITMPEDPVNLKLKAYAIDRLKQSSVKTTEVNWEAKDAYLTLTNNLGYTSTDLASQLFDESDLLRQMFNSNSTKPAVNDVLKVLYTNSSAIPKNLAYQVINEIENDKSQSFYKANLAAKAFRLLNDLGIYNLNQHASITIPRNYSAAVLGYLPQHSKENMYLIFNGTEREPALVDFSAVNVKDADGKIHSFASRNIPRDMWMIENFLASEPYVINFPELLETIGIKIQQNAFDLCDKFGAGINPYDASIWNQAIIPQWNWYWQSMPQSGNSSGRIIVCPVYNSTLLKEQIANSTDRKFAQMVFWEFWERVADLDYWNNGKVYTGFDAVTYQINTMPRLYNEVISTYPNGKMYDYDTRFHFYNWLADRIVHSSKEIGKQFLGGDVTSIPIGTGYWDRLWEFVQNLNGTDSYLNKNWKYYDLIKFIFGYGIKYGGGDAQMELIYYPIAYKAFGVPYELVHYEEQWQNIPAKFVISYDGGIFGIPDNALNPIRNGVFNETFILPGNGFDFLGSNLYGVKLDLERGEQQLPDTLKYIREYTPLRSDPAEGIILSHGGTPSYVADF